MNIKLRNVKSRLSIYLLYAIAVSSIFFLITLVFANPVKAAIYPFTLPNGKTIATMDVLKNKLEWIDPFTIKYLPSSDESTVYYLLPEDAQNSLFEYGGNPFADGWFYYLPYEKKPDGSFEPLSLGGGSQGHCVDVLGSQDVHSLTVIDRKVIGNGCGQVTQMKNPDGNGIDYSASDDHNIQAKMPSDKKRMHYSQFWWESKETLRIYGKSRRLKPIDQLEHSEKSLIEDTVRQDILGNPNDSSYKIYTWVKGGSDCVDDTTNTLKAAIIFHEDFPSFGELVRYDGNAGKYAYYDSRNGNGGEEFNRCFFGTGGIWERKDALGGGFAQNHQTPISHKENYTLDASDAEPPGGGLGGESGSGAAGSGNETSCEEESSSSIGWILCPITRTLHSALLSFFEHVVQDQLEINLSDTEEAGLKTAWSGFRVIANVLFIAVFLVIIYSQAVGGEISNAYNIKRLMPRLILVVIGVQLSFFIVSYLINVFNIIGASVGSLMLAPVEGLQQFSFQGIFDQYLNDLNPFTNVGGEALDALFTGGLLAGLGIAALLYLPTILLFGLIGFLLLFFTLIARKIIIIVLVVISPIAFIAALLPNTERVFKFWWDTFIKTLVMYPIIVMLIAAGQLVGRIALIGRDDTFVDSIISFVAAFLPLFLIPFTFKMAGSAIAGVAGGLSSLGERVKGDLRDPHSLRSSLRSRRKAFGDRMMSGEKVPLTRGKVPYIPTPVRRALKRLPITQSNAGLIADIEAGQAWANQQISTGGDDLLRAMAVTGGGNIKGVRVSTAEGKSVNSGYLQFGKQFQYDNNGNIATNNRGVALLSNGDEATTSDFYSNELMAEARKHGVSRGKLQGALNYTMTRAVDEEDAAQVWHGLNGSRWSSQEKQDMANGVWYTTKDSDLQNKFLDYGYFDQPVKSGSGEKPRLMNDTVDKKKKSFGKLAEYVDAKVGAYELSRQSGVFWRAANEGLAATERVDPQSRKGQQIKGLYEKAVQAVGDASEMQKRQAQPEFDEEGHVTGYRYQQATSESIREMRNFIKTYENLYGGGSANAGF